MRTRLVVRLVLQQFYNQRTKEVVSIVCTMVGRHSNTVTHAGSSTFLFVRNGDKS